MRNRSDTLSVCGEWRYGESSTTYTTQTRKWRKHFKQEDYAGICLVSYPKKVLIYTQEATHLRMELRSSKYWSKKLLSERVFQDKSLAIRTLENQKIVDLMRPFQNFIFQKLKSYKVRR